MATPNLDRICKIEAERNAHLRRTLEIIRDFPITDAANQDAHNMALMARQALRATTGTVTE